LLARGGWVHTSALHPVQVGFQQSRRSPRRPQQPRGSECSGTEPTVIPRLSRFAWSDGFTQEGELAVGSSPVTSPWPCGMLISDPGIPPGSANLARKSGKKSNGRPTCLDPADSLWHHFLP